MKCRGKRDTTWHIPRIVSRFHATFHVLSRNSVSPGGPTFHHSGAVIYCIMSGLNSRYFFCQKLLYSVYCRNFVPFLQKRSLKGRSCIRMTISHLEKGQDFLVIRVEKIFLVYYEFFTFFKLLSSKGFFKQIFWKIFLPVICILRSFYFAFEFAVTYFENWLPLAYILKRRRRRMLYTVQYITYSMFNVKKCEKVFLPPLAETTVL